MTHYEVGPDDSDSNSQSQSGGQFHRTSPEDSDPPQQPIPKN
jgi:hypothetical protein